METSHFSRLLLFPLRQENHTRYIASVNHFQAQQAQKKKNDVRAAKLASDSERRNFVNELYDDAKAKGYQETVKEKQIRDLRGAGIFSHTVRNPHFLSKNSTLISHENCRFFG